MSLNMKTIIKCTFTLLSLLFGGFMHLAAQTQTFEVTLDATSGNIDIYSIKPQTSCISSSLGLNDPFIVTDKQYLMIKRAPPASNQNIDLSYPKMWGELTDISTNNAKTSLKMKSYVFCEVPEDSIGHMHMKDPNIDKDFEIDILIFKSTSQIVPNRPDDLTLHCAYIEKGKREATPFNGTFKQLYESSNSLKSIKNLKLDSITFISGKYCIIDSIKIDDTLYPVVPKDNFLEETKLTVSFPNSQAFSTGEHKVSYKYKFLKEGKVDYSTVNAASFEIEEGSIGKGSIDFGWVRWMVISLVFILLVIGGIYGYFRYVQRIRENLKKKIETIIAKKLQNAFIDEDTKSKLLTFQSNAETIVSTNKLKEILNQVMEFEINPNPDLIRTNLIKEIIRKEIDSKLDKERDERRKKELAQFKSNINYETDITVLVETFKKALNVGQSSLPVNRSLTINEIVGLMKADKINHPNQEVREKLTELKAQIRNEGVEDGKRDTINIVSIAPSLLRPSLKGDIKTPFDLVTYIENVISYEKQNAKEEAIKVLQNSDEEATKYSNQITELKNQVSTLTEGKETAETLQKEAKAELAKANSKIEDLNSQINALQNRVITIDALDEAQKESIIEEARIAVKTEYEQQLQAKQSEIDKISGTANTYQSLMEKYQKDLAQEKQLRNDDRTAASKELINAVNDVRTEMQQAKEDACAELQQKLDDANDALATAEQKHLEAIKQQKEQHAAAKLQWNEDKKSYEAAIAAEKQGRLDDQEQAKANQKKAVEKAIRETEELNQEILKDEISKHQLENENAKAELAKTKADAEALLLQTKKEAEDQLTRAKEESTTILNSAKAEMQSQIDNALQLSQEAVSERQAERQILAYEMQQHIARLYQQLLNAFSNAVANYKSEGDSLVSEVEQLYNWYQANIVAPFQSPASLTQTQMTGIMQQECLRQLSDRYSIVSRLIRLVAYSQISTLWVEWMTQQGVNLQALRIAYGELTALLGLCKVTLVVPSLFIDPYKPDTSSLDMSFTPILNYCPKDFDYLTRTEIPVIRDLSNPGYLIDGNLQAIPVVMAQ